MGAIEVKFCSGVMVEVPQGPAIGCVAACALCPERRLVVVLRAVAIHAFAFGQVKLGAVMTGFAGGRGVHAL